MDSSLPIFHGIKRGPDVGPGRLCFGVAKFIHTLEEWYARPGSRHRHPSVPEWPDSAFDDWFRFAGEKLWDTVWKIDRVAELVNQARNNIRELRDGMPHEELSQHVSALRDIPIHLESIIFYIRIFADCLANLTPSMYGVRGRDIPKHRFREQRKWFLSKCPDFDAEYTAILEGSTKWFDVLAGNPPTAGIRDSIVHDRGGIELIFRPATKDQEAEIGATLYSDYRSICTNLFPVLKTLVRELFVFLDRFLVHFNHYASTQTGSPVLKLGNPDLVTLFHYDGMLPSAWLYPDIAHDKE